MKFVLINNCNEKGYSEMSIRSSEIKTMKILKEYQKDGQCKVSLMINEEIEFFNAIVDSATASSFKIDFDDIEQHILMNLITEGIEIALGEVIDNVSELLAFSQEDYEKKCLDTNEECCNESFVKHFFGCLRIIGDQKNNVYLPAWQWLLNDIYDHILLWDTRNLSGEDRELALQSLNHKIRKSTCELPWAK